MYSVCFDVGVVCLLLLAFINGLAGDGECVYSTQLRLQSADCSDKKLEDIPSNLPTNTEVLDVSYNHIRDLKNNSFKCCTSIKILYLQVNSISEVESHAFQPLGDLSVLDLSRNVIEKLPSNISPNLRRLYLDDNPRLFKNETANELPITPLRSLEFLSIAKCKLKKFPSFGGPIPNLIELDIRNNTIEEISDDDLAPLCELKFLHFTPNSLFKSKDKLCECLKFEHWTSTYGIQVTSFKCVHDKSISIDKCDTKPSNATMSKREACLNEVRNRKIPFYLMTGGGILAVIICVCILLYVRYRRRRRELSGRNGHQRNAVVKYDNKGEENGVNPAFNGYGGGRGVETTV